MGPLAVLKLVGFVLQSGPSIVSQADSLIDFAKSLLESYGAESTPGVLTASASAAFADDEAISKLADSHPMVAASCAQYRDPEHPAANAIFNGAFRDLFRAIADNPQKYIDLFLIFRDLFGSLEVQGGPDATTGQPGSTSTE